MRVSLRFALLFVAFIPFVSCSFFAPAPPLPRHAQIESKSSDQEFSALIDAADIIYFPSEAADLAHRSNIESRLLESLHRSGSGFAIGSDAESGTEFQRRVAVEGKRLEAEIVEFHSTPLTSADNPSSGRDAEPITDEIIASRIAAYAQEHRAGKVLVFLRRERLGRTQGVPYLVAQRTKARQLVLNPQARARPGGLMAGGRNGWGLDPRRFQVVDRTPFSRADQR